MEPVWVVWPAAEEDVGGPPAEEEAAETVEKKRRRLREDPEPPKPEEAWREVGWAALPRVRELSWAGVGGSAGGAALRAWRMAPMLSSPGCVPAACACRSAIATARPVPDERDVERRGPRMLPGVSQFEIS